MDDDEIRSVVTRLARRDRDGGHAIERSAILAEGSDCAEIEAWIVAHGGAPETQSHAVGRGLHAQRSADAAAQRPPVNARYVLPRGALDA
jgi:hypothetical protein